jgi:hypothetical protein
VSGADVLQLVIGALQGLTLSSVFILALFIGFCVVVGMAKLKKTAGGSASVIKSLDERMTRQPMIYLTPGAPRGPADQLRSPELLERV